MCACVRIYFVKLYINLICYFSVIKCALWFRVCDWQIGRGLPFAGGHTKAYYVIYKVIWIVKNLRELRGGLPIKSSGQCLIRNCFLMFQFFRTKNILLLVTFFYINLHI